MKKSTGRPQSHDARPSPRILAGDLFSVLGSGAADELKRIQQPKIFTPGSFLFQQQSEADDIFIIVAGRVRLMAHNGGRRIDLRTSGPGEILGLSAAISGTPHQYCAFATELVQAQVISRKRLLSMVESNAALWPMLLRYLSKDVSFAFGSLIAIGTEAVRHHHARM